MRLETAVVRVLIVDDFAAWRHYVRWTLQKDPQFKVIAEGADGEEAVRKAKETQPDLVLLDLALPKLNGIAALRGIRESSPKSKVLLMSVEQSPEVVNEALRCGAAGYVVKNDAANDLLLALEAILQRRQFVSRSVNGTDPGKPARDFRMKVVESPSLLPNSIENRLAECSANFTAVPEPH